MTRYPELNNDPIRRPKEIALILHVSLSVVKQLMKSGALPKIRVSPRCVGVLQSDIDIYLQNNNDPIRRPKEIVLILHVSLSVVKRLMKSGALPKIRVSPRCVGVLQSDIDIYLQNQRTQKKPFES